MKKLILLALLLSIGFLGFGCVETPDQNVTDNGTVTDTATTAAIVFFYDPGVGLGDELGKQVEAHFPNAEVEHACVDFTRMVYNQPSESETTCIEKDGSDVYSQNMQTMLGLLDAGAQSPIFVLKNGEYNEVLYSLHPGVVAKNICSVNSFSDCSGVSEPEPLEITTYVVDESDASLFEQLTGALEANGVTVEETVEVADEEDISMLTETTSANFLPVMLTGDTDADTQFVLDLFVQDINSGAMSVNAEKIDNAYAFYPPMSSLDQYIGTEPLVSAVAYVPEGDAIGWEGVFDGFADHILLDITYTPVDEETAGNISEETGEYFFPILVIDEADLTEEQAATLDSLVDAPIDGSVYLKKVGSKYVGYTLTAAPSLYTGAKQDSVTFDLYVMSQCPYGTQMQKALIPVVELFDGNDKLTVNNKFVYYTMHGESEVAGNLAEYCVAENYPEKEWDFIRCYIENSGDNSKCLADLQIDETEINTCSEETKTEFGIAGTAFPIYQDENEQYGVQGSPTLVFMGKKLTINRDPEIIKEFVCDILAEPPAECSTVLEYNIQPGFGPVNAEGTTTTGSTATCG